MIFAVTFIMTAASAILFCFMFPTLVWGHGHDITQDPFMMSYTEIHSL